MGGGLESRCVGRVYGADGSARHHVGVGLTLGVSFAIRPLFLRGKRPQCLMGRPHNQCEFCE